MGKVVKLTYITDEVHLASMFGYAQSMICHAWASANVTEDEDVDNHSFA